VVILVGMCAGSLVHNRPPANIFMGDSGALLLDLILTVVRRTRAGKHPWAPDALHLHHSMIHLGHSKRRAVLVLYFWAALIAFIPVLMSVTTQHQPCILAGRGSPRP